MALMHNGDGIRKINCYSLSDFHDCEQCPFRFVIRHNLDRKYEIDESSGVIALGNLLDQSIKRFHKENVYGTKSSKRLIQLIKDAEAEMRYLVAEATYKGKHHFFEATIPFLNEEVVNQAIQIFTDYYVKRKGNIRKSLGEVGFCEYPIKIDSGSSESGMTIGGSRMTEVSNNLFKLWGGPDCLEI